MAHFRCECGASEAYGAEGEHLSLCPKCRTPVDVEVVAKPYDGIPVAPATSDAPAVLHPSDVAPVSVAAAV